MKLTMLVDSQCPLCAAEVRTLQKHDKHNLLSFEDVHADDFNHKFPDLERKACFDTLHVVTQHGEIIRGLDGTCAVWQAVGKHRWLQILRLPGIRLVADFAYRIFADNRGLFSKLILGKARCQECEKL